MDLFSDSDSGSGSSSSRSSSPEADIIEEAPPKDIRINKEYAARFQHNSERAELQRLKEKHGSAALEDESSDSETEDEDGEQMTADVDAAIIATLAKIRRKDESIYDAGKRVFEEERSLVADSGLLPRSRRTTTSRGKGVTLSQYQRERIQHLLATSQDPAQDLADATAIERRAAGPLGTDEDTSYPKSYAREEEDLRREVTDAFHRMADDPDELFTKKGANAAPTEEDPEEYRRFLTRVLGGGEAELRAILRSQTQEASEGAATSSSHEVSKPKSRPAPKRNESDDEEFLTNYILNRGWLEHQPSKPKAKRSSASLRDQVLSEAEEAASDDGFESQVEAFESAYNYRFQDLEEGKIDPQIQSYARRIEGSARRQDNKRKTDREERKRRKAQEREQKRAELERLRDLKRSSISDRLAKLREITGSTAVDFGNFGLDEEFDPEQHDKLMAATFDDRYYQDNLDEKKPVFDEEYDADGTGDLHAHDDRVFGEDVELVNGSHGKPLTKAEKKKLKKREKAQAQKAFKAEQDTVDVAEMDADTERKAEQPDEDFAGMNMAERKRKASEMIDEYYGLDFEDVVGGQPTRFRYTEVPKSDFGLSATEILLADDDELNKVVGLKRLQPYRRTNSKKGPADLKARLNEFRRNFERKNNRDEAQEQGEKPKKAGKRERERKKAAAARSQAEQAS